ncbi:uncharacterized protein LOC134249404 [Saccostrea cucullata]|uniref:uncharacterized protein LOC134249404 n=1 Tax=Saccostrea cuccullata TaxID=36930 RepID=UPI002ED23FF4
MYYKIYEIQNYCHSSSPKIYTTDVTACEIGTFGVNCSGGPCPYGSYGLGCSEKCYCTTDQYCDRKTGCTYNYSSSTNDTKNHDRDGQSYVISTVSAVAIAVFLGVGSILVIIVFLYNERLKFLRQYLTKLGTNRVENDDATRESEMDQEDYSQMTRASSNYNMLSFNRFNVVSRVNVTEEEEIYDQGGAVIPSQTEDSQDSYVSLALRQNHVTPSSNGIKEVICDVEEEGVSDKTYGSRDSYITLALNPSTSPKTKGNTKGNTGKCSKQKTQAGCSNKNNQDIHANTLPRFPLNYYVLENNKIDSKGKKRNMNDTL